VDPVRVVALVPAHREADRIADTVSSLAEIDVLDEIVVVDDGSEDGTASAALAAGATVLRVPVRVGKGVALEGALRRLPAAGVWLFADADLGRHASNLERLVQEVVAGRADLAIAGFPPLTDGGFGLVKRASGRAIRTLCGFDAAEPLSGQRAITAACLAAVRPLAAGFGLETAMTIDAVRAGFRVVEIPIEGLSHRPTGRSWRGFLHRGRQGVDIARAASLRAVRLR
jgi:glycosyltransferase involved in cell wall biosynthesis